MISTLVAGAALLVVVGVVLFVLGVRGRRINDHPLCRDCGFDLLAHFEPGGSRPRIVTCPECGAGLKRSKAIRTGARRKMPALVGLGVFLCIVGVAPLSALAYARLAGTDLQAYKPLSVLMYEARKGTKAEVDAAAVELTRRISNQGLSKEARLKVIDLALEIQGDRSRPWAEAWGDIIETGYVDGVVDKERYKRFLNQVHTVSVRVRERTAAAGEETDRRSQGTLVPVEITLSEPRLGSGSAVISSVFLREVKDLASGKRLRRHFPDLEGILSGLGAGGRGAQHSAVKSAQPLATEYAMGSKSPMGGAFGGNEERAVVAAVEVPKSFEVGPDGASLDLEVSVALQTSVFDMSSPGAMMSAMRYQKDRARMTVTSASVRIEPASRAVELVRAAAGEEKETDRLESELRPEDVTGHSMGGGAGILALFGVAAPNGSMVMFSMDVERVDVPLAHEVWVVPNAAEGPGKAERIGFVCEKPTVGATFESFGVYNDGKRRFHAYVSGAKGNNLKTIDIILKPKREVALLTIDQDEFYDAEIVIRGVEVIDQSEQIRQYSRAARESETAGDKGEESDTTDDADAGVEPAEGE